MRRKAQIVPGRGCKQGMFAVNVYSNPKDYGQKFKTLLRAASNQAKRETLVVGGG